MDRLEQKTLLSKDYQLNFREPPINNQKKLVENSLRMIKHKVFDSGNNSTHIEMPKQSKDIQITIKELANITENSKKIHQANINTKKRCLSLQGGHQSQHSQQSNYDHYNLESNKNIQDKNIKQDDDFYNVQQYFSEQQDQKQTQNQCGFILNNKEFSYLFNRLNKEKNGIIRDKILQLESKKPDFMIYQTKQTENPQPRLLEIQENVVKYSAVDQAHQVNLQKKVLKPRDYSPFINVSKNIMMSHRQDHVLQNHLQNTNAHAYMKNHYLRQELNSQNTNFKDQETNQIGLQNKYKPQKISNQK